MENPTIVVLTDRNDLDDQLFGTFSRCQDLLRQPPVQAESRPTFGKSCRSMPAGVVFTTIQKFFPEEKGDRHPVLSTAAISWSSPMKPTAASMISSTALPAICAMLCPTPPSSALPARPLRMTDTNTRAVFGDYISIYDIQRAVEDGATVPIYYESRLAKLELDEPKSRRSTPSSKKSPKAKRSSARRSSRPSGRSLKPSSAPKNV